MRNLRSQEEIMASWKGDPDKPVVSICCITYNHEPYIEDALNGFLIQETDFPIEILVHDDASTDRTADIIQEYESTYPKLIKTHRQIENQFSRGRRWFQFLTPKIKSDYIALCEGDDYWTDPNKLKIQIGFLNNNSDYVVSGHDAFVIDSYGNFLSKSKLPDYHKKDFTEHELRNGKAWILTMSCVYRNIQALNIPERCHVLNGDKFFTSLLGRYGKSKFHHEIKPACYRQHPGGVWSSLNENEKMFAKLNTYIVMRHFYNKAKDNDLKSNYESEFYKSLACGIKLKDLTFITYCFFINKLKNLRNLFK